MAKKRILIVIAGNNGTIGMCSRNLYLALKQQDTLEVKCVGIHHFENGIAELEDIEYYQPTGNFLTRNIGVLSQICWLRNVKKVFRPDITISTLFSTSVINVLSGECGKTIGIFHSPHQQLKVFGPINYFITLCNYTLVYPRLDKLACVSEEVKDSLAVFPFIPKKKVEVIYNVHNAALIRKMADMNLPTEEKDLLSHPYVLYCGRMDENKAPRRALEAFAKAHRPGDANIVYIGHEENGQLERLLQRAKELGISDKIHYLGKKANPYPYMRHARALISSSYSEGLPGVMIESLILGTPVITTNSSKGIWEIFSCTNRYQRELRDNFRNECGYITPNLSFKDPAQHDYDIDHLADAISSIWKSDKVEAFPFERKVSAEYIFNQYNNLPEMRLSRFIKKAVYTISKFFVVKLAYVDSRLYMEYYCKILKNSGLRGGVPRFIAGSVKFDTFELIEIGDRTTISSNVILLTHDYSYTNALRAVGDAPKTDIGVIRPITIGANCFIGMNVLVLPGTIVEDNVIVGAGSVIRGRLEANSVYVGNPAKRVMSMVEYVDKIGKKNYQLTIDKK